MMLLTVQLVYMGRSLEDVSMDALWKLWAALLAAWNAAWQFIKTAWEITLGKVIQMYNLPFWSLPLVEQLIYIGVMLAIVLALAGSARQLWSSMRNLVQALVDFIVAIFTQARTLLYVLVLAIIGAWIVTTFNLDVGLPNLQTLWKQLRS